MNNQRNLPDLFNGLYENCIAQKLNNSEFQLLSAILYKFNKMFFPDKLEISNTELRGMSNLSASTFSRSRNLILRRKSLDGQPYLTYKSSDRQDKAGTYSINYDAIVVQRVCNDTAMKNQENEKTIADPLQSDVDFEHDHNITKHNNFTEPKKYSDKESVIIQLIQELWPGHVIHPNTVPYDTVEEILQYDIEPITEAFNAAMTAGLRKGNLNWILNRLRYPERYGLDDKEMLDKPITKEEREHQEAINKINQYHESIKQGIFLKYGATPEIMQRHCGDILKLFDRYPDVDVKSDREYWQTHYDKWTAKVGDAP